MSGALVRFRSRRVRAVVICRERDELGWLTIVGSAGWLFGSLTEARSAARWLARNLGLPIREVAT